MRHDVTVRAPVPGTPLPPHRRPNRDHPGAPGGRLWRSRLDAAQRSFGRVGGLHSLAEHLGRELRARLRPTEAALSDHAAGADAPVPNWSTPFDRRPGGHESAAHPERAAQPAGGARPTLAGFSHAMDDADARAWLRSLPGVGPKTAGIVLCFAMGRPVLPVDTHVFRVAWRLGLIENESGRRRRTTRFRRRSGRNRPFASMSRSSRTADRSARRSRRSARSARSPISAPPIRNFRPCAERAALETPIVEPSSKPEKDRAERRWYAGADMQPASLADEDLPGSATANSPGATETKELG